MPTGPLNAPAPPTTRAPRAWNQMLGEITRTIPKGLVKSQRMRARMLKLRGR